jgi:hypothetical protein
MSRMKEEWARLHGDLFASPPLPPWSRGGTSEEAADSVRDSAATLRKRIGSFVRQRGLQGVICAEVEEIFALEHQTASARLWELETRSLAKSARKVREMVPRELFVINKPEYPGRIVRPNPRGERNQLVYFSFHAVTVEQVMQHYGLRRELP